MPGVGRPPPPRCWLEASPLSDPLGNGAWCDHSCSETTDNGAFVLSKGRLGRAWPQLQSPA